MLITYIKLSIESVDKKDVETLLLTYKSAENTSVYKKTPGVEYTDLNYKFLGRNY